MCMSFPVIYQSLAHTGKLDQRNSFAKPPVLAHPDNKVVWAARHPGIVERARPQGVRVSPGFSDFFASSAGKNNLPYMPKY